MPLLPLFFWFNEDLSLTERDEEELLGCLTGIPEELIFPPSLMPCPSLEGVAGLFLLASALLEAVPLLETNFGEPSSDDSDEGLSFRFPLFLLDSIIPIFSVSISSSVSGSLVAAARSVDRIDCEVEDS